MVRSSSQKRDEGDQEKKLKPNRLGQSEEEIRAELWVPSAATGTAGTTRGSPATAREAPWSRERWARWESTREVSKGSGAVGRPTEPVRLNPLRTDVWVRLNKK